MKKFSDLNLQTKLSGDKIEIREIFDKEITVTAFRIGPSKQDIGKRCLTLQFRHEGRLRILFTGSEVLMKDLENLVPFEEFETTITKETGSNKTWFKFN